MHALNTFLLLLGISPALSLSGSWECEDAKACTCLPLKCLTSCLSIFTALVLARLYITCASFIACHERGGWNNQPVQLFAGDEQKHALQKPSSRKQSNDIQSRRNIE